jgi:hypothetical protein
MWEELQVKVDELPEPQCEARQFYGARRRPHN